MPSTREFNADLASRFARWLRVQEYVASTNRHYLAYVVSLCEFLNDIPVTEATHLDIRDFLASIAQKGLKRSTIWRAMSGLRCFFDFLNMGGLMNWAPPRFVRLRQLKRTVPRVLTEKQIGSLLSKTCNLYERIIIELLYGTGARAGEIRTMRVEDVDLLARRIRVLGKCGYRYVLFPRAIASCLRQYIGKRTNGYLLVSRCSRRLHLIHNPNGSWRSYFYKYNPATKRLQRLCLYVPKGDRLTHHQALRRIRRKLPNPIRDIPIGKKPLGVSTLRHVVMRVGLKVGIHVNPQLLRHTFATHLLDNGADIRMIQKMLGHISVGTTQTYTHVNMSQVQKVMDQCHPRNL